ncbi:MAG: GNAT family N-acetyltransferase [Ferruginibacter sp.]
MEDQYYKLDNPAWYALNEKHQAFAVGTGEIKKYQRHIAPWVGYVSNNKNILEEIDPFTEPGEGVYIFDQLPALPGNYTLETELVCMQMICTKPVQTSTANPGIKKQEDAGEIETLINMVQPGYYNPGTCLMGEYYGIREDGLLVALAGERMRMDGLTEISGVVTHPAYTGRGYAQQLVAYVTNKNLAAGITAFLHVAATNERAIKLYEYLGYTNRRFITVRKIRKLPG